MIGIPVQAGRDGGIFNRVSGTPPAVAEKCRALAREVERTISDHYGVAMPAFLRAMVPRRARLVKRIQRIIDKFVERMRANTDPWERRFAEKFGIVLAGAILMSEFGIGPWTTKRARRAVARLYKLARSITVSVNQATDALLRHLRKLVITGKRFPFIKKGMKYNKSENWGLTRKMPDGTNAVLIQLPRFDQLVKPSAISKAALIELDTRGVLVKGSDDKRTRQVMINGTLTRSRYVCLNRRELLSE